jgi:lycopene beta-cyclase
VSGRFEGIIVGGGLAGGLAALALLHRRPSLRLALVEREPHLGGSHTWSFHQDDAPPAARPWLEPLVAHRWDGYAVRFPGLRRELAIPYASIPGHRLDTVVQARLKETGAPLLTGREASRLSARAVDLADGERLEADWVLDARGPLATQPTAGTGFQKFVGLEVRLSAPYAPVRPILMDATVAQQDGYRFLYLLPFGPERVLVEDTCFANGPALDRDRLRAGALAYLEERGLAPAEVVREEEGVLPMPWRVAPRTPVEALAIGVRGGFFHPGTGYSLAAAVRLAHWLASLPTLPPPDETFADHTRGHARQAAFARMLNAMFFRLPGGARWRLLERFYRLPEPVIRRYYSLETTWADRARILLERPPGLPWLRLPQDSADEEAR